MDIDWIERDVNYRFRLYSQYDRQRPLASVNVAMAVPAAEVAMDVAILMVVLGVPAMLISGLSWIGVRMLRSLRPSWARR